jgi:hypothetical protein
MEPDDELNQIAYQLQEDLERLQAWQKRKPCREKALAITKLEESLLWLFKVPPEA